MSYLLRTLFKFLQLIDIIARKYIQFDVIVIYNKREYFYFYDNALVIALIKIVQIGYICCTSLLIIKIVVLRYVLYVIVIYSKSTYVYTRQ